MSSVQTDTEIGARRLPGPTARIPDCPLARTVEVVGHWWTLEILHELFDGHTRFEAIRHNLDMAADVLRQRIDDLVAKGLVESTTAVTSREQQEYRLTPLGRSLRPLLLIIAGWGNHRLLPEERSVILVDTKTGVEVEPVVVDRRTGMRIDTEDIVFARGPKASARIVERYPEISVSR